MSAPTGYPPLRAARPRVAPPEVPAIDDGQRPIEPPSAAADPTAQTVPLAGSSRSAYVALLRDRDFRLWFSSSLVSSLGDWMGFVALQALVVSLSSPGSRTSLFALGGVMMARLVPSLVVGPVAGVLADRYDRKRLMVTTDVLRGGLFVWIALSGNLTALFLLTFAVECLSLLYMAAKDASLPNLVRREHLTQANQLNLLVAYGTLPFGAVLATAVAVPLTAAGLDPTAASVVALLINAATFLVGALLIAFVRLPSAARRATAEERPGVVEDLREGLRFIQGLPLIRSLILGVMGVFFGAGVVVALGPAFVRSELGQASTDWFTLMTFVGVGLLVGIVAAGPLSTRVRHARLFPVTLTATGAIATVMATLDSFVVALGFGLGLGAAAGLSFVVGYTLLHEHTPEDVRGKTFAAFYTGTRVALFVALGITPFLAAAIGRGTLILGTFVATMSGVRIAILLGGVVATVSAVAAGRGMYRTLRDAERPRGVVLPEVASPDRPADGLFIAFEGVEGAGKSTQVKRLAALLREEGHDVVVTREPGGAPLAERIRDVLLDPEADGMHARTEALLYAAARTEHLNRVILPALSQGKVVICDRYLDSSLAYQGWGRALGEADVAEINRWAIGGVLPDVVVLLRLDPEEGLRRVAERTRRARAASPGAAGADRLEREGLEFHRRVADGYLALARRDRARYLVVDGSAEAGTVAREIRRGLASWLPLPKVPVG